MAIELVNTPNYEFKNNKLRQFTEQIFKQGLNIKKAYARIAVTLAKIEESQCYEMDGFENTSDYAQKVLGIGYTQSRQFIRLGREFIDSKSLESVLQHEEGHDYTTTQLQALLPLGSVMWAQELAIDGTVNPSMTVKEIKSVVKDLLAKDKGETEESEATEETEATEEPIEAVGWEVRTKIELAIGSDGSHFVFVDDGISSVMVEAKDALNLLQSWITE